MAHLNAQPVVIPTKRDETAAVQYWIASPPQRVEMRPIPLCLFAVAARDAALSKEAT